MVDTPSIAAPEGVLAVVVTAGLTPHLADVLAAVSTQHRAPDALLVVNVADQSSEIGTILSDCGLDAGRASLVTVSAPNLGTALAAGLSESGATCRWLWLLHDDSIPDDDALAALLEAAGQSTSIAVAGCKQRRLDDTAALIEVGVTTTRFGRRFVDVVPGTIDQGQCDDRDDVFAVGTAGMLVAADVWRLIGGFDPALGPFGDGLEFCRRVRLAGFRVVVVPDAIVFHGRSALLGLRTKRRARGGSVAAAPTRSASARRRSFIYVQFIGAPLALLPFVIVAALIAAIGRALWRTAAKQPGLALGELVAPLAVLGHPGAIARGRARLRRVSRLPRRSLRSLQADASEIRLQRRAARLSASGRESTELDDLELAHRATSVRRRRVTLFLLLVAFGVLSALTLGRLLGAVGLHGGALLPLDGSLGGLWAHITSSWQATGLGYSGAGDPLWFVLAGASVLTLGHPQLAVNAVFVIAPFLAGLGAWWAAGAATRSLPARAWASLAWVAAPPLWFAIAQGRLGAVLAHVALPMALLALARAAGVNRLDDFTLPAPDVLAASQSRSRRGAQVSRRARREGQRQLTVSYGPGSIAAAAAAALLLAVVVAGAPVLAVPLEFTVLLLVVAARGGRLRLVIAALGPVIALAPLLYSVLRPGSRVGWQALLADPSLSVAAEPAARWLQLLGWPLDPQGLGLGRASAIVLGGLVVVLALAALARVGARGWGIRIAWLIAVVTAVFGAWSVTVTTGLDTEAGTTLGPWPGSLVSLMTASLVAAGLAGLDGLTRAVAAHAFGWRQVSAVVVGVIIIGVPLAAIGSEADYVRQHGELAARRSDPVPVIAIQTGLSGDATRTLLLATSGGEIDWQIVRGQGPQLTDFTAISAQAAVLAGTTGAGTGQDDASQQISQAVAQLALRGQGDSIRTLADAAIGYIVVPQPDEENLAATNRLTAALSASNALISVNQDESGGAWRVAPDQTVTSNRPARARIVDPKGASVAVVDSGPETIDTTIDATGSGLVIQLAERSDEGWRATLNGTRLSATTDGWRQTFELPANPAGRLVIKHVSGSLELILWAQGVVVILLALLAVPLSRSRQARGEEV